MCLCVPNLNHGLIEKWSKKINNYNLLFVEAVQLKERVLAKYQGTIECNGKWNMWTRQRSLFLLFEKNKTKEATEKYLNKWKINH